jgi:TPR repeat protein
MSNNAHLLFRLARDSEYELDRSSYMFDCAHWLRVCLDHNDNIQDAHFLMGFLSEQGLSVDKNLKAAFEHYLRASELGHVKATTKLAHFYYSGVRAEQPSSCEDEL